MKCSYACGSDDHLLSRRRFLGGLAAGVGVASQFGFSKFVQPSIATELQNQAKQILVIWLAGGASQLETWDPKPGTETGGPFRSIDTSVPGTRISELLPKTARLMHHISLVRGINTKENDHAKGQYMMHTGRPEMPGVAHPHFGSMAAKYLGSEANPLPGYIHITPGGGGRTGTESAYLGPKYAALYLGNGQPPSHTTRPGLVDEKGETLRHDLRRRMNDRFASRRRTAETEAYTTTYEQALQLMTRREVFDVTKESVQDQERYGNHDFGRHCLLARRLLESGVTYVQVSHSNYDTHNENFTFHLEQVGEFDQGYSNLIDDLAARGLLKHTLVVVMSEFGRTPQINYLYGRDHWGTAWSIALAGCGIKSGIVHGRTNAKGTEVTDGEVNAGHLYHTYLRAVGLNPTEDLDVDGRIIQLGDPAGAAIKELLA